MTEIGFVTFLAWLLGAVLLYVTNRDLCSPTKIAHLYAFYFFLAFYLLTESEAVILAYWCILLLVFLGGMVEAISVRGQGVAAPVDRGLPAILHQQSDRMVWTLWLMTAVPVMAQAYMVMSMGGLTVYFANLAFRVRDFAGYGPIITVIKFMPALNIVYLGVLLCTQRPGPWRWSLLFLNVLLTIILGLFAGSRSAILMNLMFMALLYNYIRKPFRIATLLAVALPLLFMGFFLGAVRQVVKPADIIQQGSDYSLDIETLFSQTTDIRDNATANSGLISLRLLTEQGVPDPKFGQTFLTGITNLVPRAIWPEKPRTGGVVLTEEYTGNAWGGLSNLSTGIFAEGMLNFGMLAGPLFGYGAFAAMLFFFNRAYTAIRKAKPDHPLGLPDVIRHVIYIWGAQFVPAMLVAEFASAVAFMLTQLATLWLIYQVLVVAGRLCCADDSRAVSYGWTS